MRDSLLDEPKPRRFQLVRRVDESGMSGTGIVSEGLEHRDGTCVYRWLTAPATTQVADSIHDITHIHGHNGKTTVRWLDGENEPGEQKTISQVYQDRNALAVAFSKLADEIGRTRYAGGWRKPDADDADAEEWSIVWADTPAGSVSWHVPRLLVDATALEETPHEWDGHDRKEKNRRLVGLAEGRQA